MPRKQILRFMTADDRTFADPIIAEVIGPWAIHEGTWVRHLTHVPTGYCLCDGLTQELRRIRRKLIAEVPFFSEDHFSFGMPGESLLDLEGFQQAMSDASMIIKWARSYRPRRPFKLEIEVTSHIVEEHANHG